MSWQQEYLARYEQRLKEEFTIDGRRIFTVNQGQVATTSPFKSHMDVLRDFMDSVSPIWDSPTNTREICGND